MQMNDAHRRATGAYYTPQQWAKLAVAYLSLALDKPLQHYLFYDPAGGEGALLEALPQGCECIATTLEAEDVQILRSKGINAYQYDFLDCETIDLPNRLYIARNRLVVFTNPPYFKLSHSYDCRAKRDYQHNDSVALFLYRIFWELRPLCTAWFGKLDIIQAPHMRQLRQDLITQDGLKGVFVCPSKSWPGLKGNFPIGFFIHQNNRGRGQELRNIEGVLMAREGGRPKSLEDVIALADAWEATKRESCDTLELELLGLGDAPPSDLFGG